MVADACEAYNGGGGIGGTGKSRGANAELEGFGAIERPQRRQAHPGLEGHGAGARHLEAAGGVVGHPAGAAIGGGFDASIANARGGQIHGIEQEGATGCSGDFKRGVASVDEDG